MPDLRDLKVSPNHLFDNSIVSVDELISKREGGWNVALVESLFNEEEAKAILKIPISVRDSPDRLVCHWVGNGIY